MKKLSCLSFRIQLDIVSCNVQIRKSSNNARKTPHECVYGMGTGSTKEISRTASTIAQRRIIQNTRQTMEVCEITFF